MEAVEILARPDQRRSARWREGSARWWDTDPSALALLEPTMSTQLARQTPLAPLARRGKAGLILNTFASALKLDMINTLCVGVTCEVLHSSPRPRGAGTRL